MGDFSWCFLCQVCYVCFGQCLFGRRLHICLFEITNVAHENNILVLICIGRWILVKHESGCFIWNLSIELIITSIGKVIFFKTVIPIDFGAHQDQITVLVYWLHLINRVFGLSIRRFIKFGFYSYSLNEVFEIHFFELHIIRCLLFTAFVEFMLFSIWWWWLFNLMSNKFIEMLIWDVHISF